MLQFTAKAIKATLVLNAAEVAATDVVGDTAFFTIAVGGDQKITGKFNAKTFRRVVALVREHGADAVAVVAQGKLVNGKLEEAGITGQLRTPKPVADILV
jgi:phage terminase large subunit-like protein